MIWDKLTVDLERPYSITGAPRVVNGKVLIGNGGGELGGEVFITRLAEPSSLPGVTH